MRAAAWPSPKGFLALRMRSYRSRSCWSARNSRHSRSASVPTSLPAPAAISSGLSVVSRSTRIGTRADTASSWMPPESDRISHDLDITHSSAG